MLLALAFCLAPTPGDIGGCGQSPQDLDEEIFFDTKHAIDCERCTECGLSTSRCQEACDGTLQRSFPPRCEPLVHDGEVCLRKLLAASCDDYAGYVDDRRAKVPTECDFCPAEQP